MFYNISIVHARSRAPAWSCLIATKFTGRKFVTTYHGTYNFRGKIKKFYNSIMLRSNLIIAGSNFIFSHIKDNYSELINVKKKLLVIFRGINVDYFDPSTKIEEDEKKLLNEWGLNKEKKIILMPGRLTAWKGQELFLNAVNLVNIELGYEAFYAVILGNDQGRDQYKKKLIELTEKYKIANQVKFFDHCEELIIASNIGGSNETIIDEKTGFLFESGDPKSLAKKIMRALTMDETSLKKIGIEGRKNVIKKFNVEKMCFSTYSEYKRLIN